MTITGTLDAAGRDLVLSRTVPAPAHRIWEHLTRSPLLATWYGTFTGDPTTGAVQVTMTAEPGEASTSEYVIHSCDPERLLSVSSSMGEDAWRLSLELDAVGEEGGLDAGGGDQGIDGDGAGAGAGTVTRLVLHHHDVPGEMVAFIGPGWEWYLDRLTGAVTGSRIPGTDVWDSEYMTLSEEYAALVA